MLSGGQPLTQTMLPLLVSFILTFIFMVGLFATMVLVSLRTHRSCTLLCVTLLSSWWGTPLFCVVQVVRVLGEERAGAFCEVYGVKAAGNCTLSARSDPHKEFGGKNVLAEVSIRGIFVRVRVCVGGGGGW